MSNPKFTRIHLGSLVEARARELHLSPNELARRVNSSPAEVERLFGRFALPTDFLFTLSHALGTDLFLPYSQELDLAPHPLIRDLEAKERTIAYLEEIAGLLRGR
ncbi:MAG: hypothetical protein H6581_00455 [Bacteroidia bacterium]|nr:hypothetical protein [Bacteroidia bacterium]